MILQERKQSTIQAFERLQRVSAHVPIRVLLGSKPDMHHLMHRTTRIGTPKQESECAGDEKSTSGFAAGFRSPLNADCYTRTSVRLVAGGWKDTNSAASRLNARDKTTWPLK